MKSWPSQWCLEANSLAIQIHGGYGYTREYPVEQLYRDNRLNLIHEGTHGVQALDLLGRKITMHDGRAIALLEREINLTVLQADETPHLSEDADALAHAWWEMRDTLAVLRPALAERATLVLAQANAFLEVFGHTVVAWLWLRQGLAAASALEDATNDDVKFYRGKLKACRYFFRYELPKMQPHHALLRRLDDTTLNMESEWF